MATVEFYHDYGSPTCYLAFTQLPKIAERARAAIQWNPILLGGVFKACDNQSPVMIAAKGKWMFEDLGRFAERFGVPFKLNPHFMINTLPMMRGAHWALESGAREAYDAAMYRAMWVDGVNLNEPAEIARVVSEAGLDADAFAAAIQDPAVKKKLIDATEAAVGRGVFGAPTFFIGEEMHFGQDRLDWVERALAA